MTTNNAVNVNLSGQTGTGTFVGSTSPTLVTPTLGAATATSVAFSPTTGGIVGTTTNDNTTAGDVGEYVNSTVLFGSAISLTNSTAADVTHISLTAGDWDVWGNIFISGVGGVTNAATWINTTSATQPDSSLIASVTDSTGYSGGGQPVPSQRMSLSGTTTVYVSCIATFGTSAVASGYISARRRR